MGSSELMVNNLITSYRKMMDESRSRLDWAVHKINPSEDLVHCTIPFVGKDYASQNKRLLVYASAEVLNEYYSDSNHGWTDNWLDDNAQAENRHRKCFNENASSNAFFPNVHISPMSNGTLSTAVYYLASALKITEARTPREFYETISFANFSKFTIETELQKNVRCGFGAVGSNENIDITTLEDEDEKRDKLLASLPFLERLCHNKWLIFDEK